ASNRRWGPCRKSGCCHSCNGESRLRTSIVCSLGFSGRAILKPISCGREKSIGLVEFFSLKSITLLLFIALCTHPTLRRDNAPSVSATASLYLSSKDGSNLRPFSDGMERLLGRK